MGSVPVFPKDPYGGAYGPAAQHTTQVDELIGSAYDVVRYVAENLEYIKHVSAHLAQIYEVSQHIEAIEAIAEQIELLEQLILNLESILLVATNIEEVVIVANEIEAVITVANNIITLVHISENIDEIIAAAGELRRVADIASLKAIDTDFAKLVFLPDDAGFDWKAINSSTPAALDPNEHIIVKRNDTSLTTGAWYRRLKGDQPGIRDAFKAKGDGIADDTQALLDAINWMEFYPQRSRALTFERGEYNFTQLVIPNHIPGISFNGVSYWDSGLKCIEDSTRHAILNQSQEFKMFDMSLTSSISNSVNWAKFKNGIHTDKGLGQPADVDCVINRCRIGGYWRGVYHKGRSLVMRGFNHMASCDYGIEFDWPAVVDYTPGTDHSTDLLGFRGNIIEGIRFHSMQAGGIINDGVNAHKANGLDIKNVHMDIGRCIFKGHLGMGGSIIGAKSLQTPLPVLELTGGTDFLVQGITGLGDRKVGDYTPDNLVRLLSGSNPGVTTGIFMAGRFSNFILGNCEEHAVRDTAHSLMGVSFDNFTFHDVGFGTVTPPTTPADWRCFSFGSQNSDIEVINPKLVGTDVLNAIVGNNYATNKIKLVNPSQQGNATPWAAGTGITSVILLSKRQNHTPTLVNVTNAAASSVVGLSWRYVGDDMIEIGGRITMQATAAGNVEVDMPLPVLTNMTQPYMAWGSCVAATASTDISGSIVGSGANIRIRWMAVNTTNLSFSLFAQYRII